MIRVFHVMLLRHPGLMLLGQVRMVLGLIFLCFLCEVVVSVLLDVLIVLCEGAVTLVVLLNGFHFLADP